MGPLSCMRSVVDRNVVIRHIPVRICWSPTWLDTVTLNKMATQRSRIKTLHGLQKIRSGSRKKFSQLCAVTWLVFMSQWEIFPRQIRHKRLLMKWMQQPAGGSFSHHQRINCKWARWTNYRDHTNGTVGTFVSYAPESNALRADRRRHASNFMFKERRGVGVITLSVPAVWPTDF
jgi:hypothetical protein